MSDVTTSDADRMDRPRVGVVMGSDSDWEVVAPCVEMLDRFGITREVHVVSAHRRPHAMLEYGATAAERGLQVLIACAGGAAHLPGMLAAATTLPVIGIPRALKTLDGMDSLLSIAQMPKGVPVATVAIDGAANAGLLAVRMLAIADPALTTALAGYRDEIEADSRTADERLQGQLP
jgi:5-(carboxyamino)imidazole ribonucleotide mutase